MLNHPEHTHVFELAGLGKAPFHFIGFEDDSDRERINNERKEQGLTYTTNNCTSCNYCGTAIHDAYVIESSDGRRFKVGCECVKKTGDRGLMKRVADEVRKVRTRKTLARRAREQDVLRGLIERFGKGEFTDALKALNHPTIPGKTAFDYVVWCLNNGRESVRGVEKLLKMVAK